MECFIKIHIHGPVPIGNSSCKEEFKVINPAYETKSIPVVFMEFYWICPFLCTPDICGCLFSRMADRRYMANHDYIRRFSQSLVL